MALPAVNLTELDGALGVLPATAGRLLAVIGNSSKGPLNLPATYGRVKDLVADFGVGPGVEAAALHIERTGRPVVFVRADTSVDGAAGTVNDDLVAGTSVITADTATVKPLDDYEVVFQVTLGGTIGTGPISFRTSLDGGRTWSPTTALGTANTYTIPNSGVVLDFAAGTLVTGDTATFRTTAPQWDTADLNAAIDALGNSSVNWEICQLVGKLDATSFDAVEAKFAGFFGRHKFHMWIGHTRVPNIGESEATYLSSLSSAFGSKATTRGALCAGAAETISAVTGRAYLRPTSFACASNEAARSEEVNTGDVNLGALVGVSIKDANGNPKHHDEYVNPGLDDARFYVLRTWNSRAGVYVNRPQLFSPQGSDFQLVPHRRVLDIANGVVVAYLERRLNRPIQVDKATGFILEEVALEIEAGAQAALEAALLATPKASDCTFVLSRTDNVLSTKTLTGDCRVTPLGYPETINVTVGYLNPALQITAQAA